MKFTINDRKSNVIVNQPERLVNIIGNDSHFRIGCTFKKAWTQLENNESENHLVEFRTLKAMSHLMDLPHGDYLARLSHTGLCKTDAPVSDTCTKPVPSRRPHLPKELKHSPWLMLDKLIHKHTVKKVGVRVIVDIENHHNIVWKDPHVVNREERELFVHRKWASPGFVVRGKSQPDSINIAHCIDRVKSRSKALQFYTYIGTKKLLAERELHLSSGGLDQIPGVYKDFHSVMAVPSDLVEVLTHFVPNLGNMCPPGEQADEQYSN